MLDFIKTIQTIASPPLDVILTILNFFSQLYFLIILVTLIYWTYDKKKGEQLAFSLIFTTAFSCGIKGVFRTSRPYTYDGIRGVNTNSAPGYSFPSADTSAAAASATTIASWTEKPVIKFFLAVFVLIIGFTRMYFGLHFPIDVLGGLIIGCGVAFGIKKIFSVFYAPILVGFISTLILIPFMFFDPQPDYFKTFGLMVGAFCGIFIEHNFVNFDYKISRGKKAARFLIGIVCLIVLSILPKHFLPQTNFFVALEKFLLTFFAVGIYPAIFKKLKF